MKKNIQDVHFLIMVLFALGAIAVSGCVAVPLYPDAQYQTSEPGIYVNGDVPQPLYFASPPDVVVVPSGEISIYMLPDIAGVYFYEGRWYRNYGGLWYQASSYNEVWVPVRVGSVPLVIRSVPPEYPLYLPSGYQRQHYREFHDRWRSWDRERYWQKQDWYRRESQAEVRRERLRSAARQGRIIQRV
jgi:hypothetical protein